jgi:hypothetical protein
MGRKKQMPKKVVEEDIKIAAWKRGFSCILERSTFKFLTAEGIVS